LRKKCANFFRRTDASEDAKRCACDAGWSKVATPGVGARVPALPDKTGAAMRGGTRAAAVEATAADDQ